MGRTIKRELLPSARVLGIETSCDETAAAVIENGRKILSNVVASQVEIHSKYGGVFPEVASRQHIRAIHTIIDEALRQSHMGYSDIDAIAVTRGPGLPGSLVVGANAAKGLALTTGIPLVGVNHLEGHIYSAWLYPNSGTRTPMAPKFPSIILLVSGGHTELILMEDHLTYHRLGGTLDDAAGEAFDKVARLLGLSYPGGPAIQKVAVDGNAEQFNFPRARLEGTWDFSFSGLKTAVLRVVREYEETNKPLPKADIAASFQAAAVDALVTKTFAAAKHFAVKEIICAGGVSANKALREALSVQADFPVHIPPLSLCTDNAAMIAGAGYFRYVSGHVDDLSFDVMPSWVLE
ncbi:MAG: tRNA (adenosine(37)-N6)-threonylcarbamoyltransferase complex transferase subunit TsaD [Anaerolineae bacterium]|jgi:N6-L-threonylcarbamoyladenine synthase|nr:tRNA (adenosine(37)-N6)-threonylcarbamoyltransferase complex transferase subunit TsaD [Anaerolineae bacterium]NPV57991.1 tRNA (adenosine(37)-N6)-threonylcarbamoyltransferase complex transferase subunit TsaD [Anaerolineae bacterium]